MKTALTGIQPTGRLHLGNFVGTLRNCLKLQEQHRCYFFIADWHALTSDYSDTGELKTNIREVQIDMLSVGLDPAKCVLFVQSDVKEHAELHLILSMFTPLPWLERMPTYKEKLQEVEGDLNSYGFLGYPVLQAADILIYKTDFVPVGIDQVPHLDLTREIGRRFNNFAGREAFVMPQPLLTEIPKLLGTDGRKMSKSYNNCIYLSDAEELITKKIRTMMTDPARIKRNDPGDADKCPVFPLHLIFNAEMTEKIKTACSAASIGCIECKNYLIEKVLEYFSPYRKKRKELENNPGEVKEIFEEGAREAKETAGRTMEEVRKLLWK